MINKPLIWLASKSPRRQELLTQMGIDFELLLPEDPIAAEALEAPRRGEAPHKYVERVTLAKLDLARAKHKTLQLPDRPILCADTTVALGGRLLGKPADRDACREMIGALSARRHRVLTAVVVAKGSRIKHTVQVSHVTFARLSSAQIDRYIATDDGMDKAGGYGIQGHAARFIRKIEGSYSGIMGLPIYETSQLLGDAF